jgi:hypothetical protein
MLIALGNDNGGKEMNSAAVRADQNKRIVQVCVLCPRKAHICTL